MTGSSLATLLITACQDSILPGSRFFCVSFCEHSGLTTFEMFCVYWTRYLCLNCLFTVSCRLKGSGSKQKQIKRSRKISCPEPTINANKRLKNLLILGMCLLISWLKSPFNLSCGSFLMEVSKLEGFLFLDSKSYVETFLITVEAIHLCCQGSKPSDITETYCFLVWDYKVFRNETWSLPYYNIIS